MAGRIQMTPIGTIHTPCHDDAEMPIQGRVKPEALGWVELRKKYEPGLRDLDGFTHAILIYQFHRSDRATTVAQPFLETETHGIFAIRSPHRPNHIGLSVVTVRRIEGNCLYFGCADMLDGTPLLDIKPYITYFDCLADAKCGWIDKHFADGRIPETATKKQAT